MTQPTKNTEIFNSKDKTYKARVKLKEPYRDLERLLHSGGCRIRIDQSNSAKVICE